MHNKLSPWSEYEFMTVEEDYKKPAQNGNGWDFIKSFFKPKFSLNDIIL
jgi:hypothetical protein